MREYRGPDGKRIITENAAEEALYKKTSQPRPRIRRIPDDKVAAVYNALWKWRLTPYNDHTLTSIDLVIFLLLTGARRGEASSLLWSNVNLTEAWWHIPDPKNKTPVWLPLSSEAVRLLTQRREAMTTAYVFNTCARTGHIGDPRAIMERVSEVAGGNISPHDLRRTWTNLAVNAAGVPLHRAELLTNHVPKSIMGLHYLERQKLQPLLPELQSRHEKIRR